MTFKVGSGGNQTTSSQTHSGFRRLNRGRHGRGGGGFSFLRSGNSGGGHNSSYSSASSGSGMCQRCGRVHQGPCHLAPNACFRCGQQGHFVRNCPFNSSPNQTQFQFASSASSAAPSFSQPRPQFSTPYQSGPFQAGPSQGRGFGGRSGGRFGGRGSGRGPTPAASFQQSSGGQARVFTLTPEEAQTSNAVVAGTISVCGTDAFVLLDPGATHSFISPAFASRVGCRSSSMSTPLSVATPLSEVLITDTIFPMCSIKIEDREMMAELILLDVIYFDVILGMDWLS